MTRVAVRPRGAHLVGSVPLKDAEEVFRVTSQLLGDRLRRIPDGETGDRLLWVGWQLPVLLNNPLLELSGEANPYNSRPLLRLRAGAKPADLRFDRLGYADVAKESFAIFARLKNEGAIPSHCRFQIDVPTPTDITTGFVVPESQAAVEAAVATALQAEVADIANTLPRAQLAIQWDCSHEFGILEGMFASHLLGSPAVRQAILDRLLRWTSWVPDDVEIGYHLCYGDYGHKHFVEPSDMTALVEVSNALAAGTQRPINFIHMPVPRGRTDDAYYAPLRQLRLHPETELYLGLVHFTDGVDGAQRRLEAALRAVSTFGVATECGLGRRPPATIPAVLRLHAEVCDPVI